MAKPNPGEVIGAYLAAYKSCHGNADPIQVGHAGGWYQIRIRHDSLWSKYRRKQIEEMTARLKVRAEAASMMTAS